MDKIKRYLDANMYDEAQSELARAVQIDEFNPQIRLLLGEVLLQQRRYEDGLKQFQISLKLDPQIWQAREGLADANYMLWESRKHLSNRIRPAESYEELLSFKPSEPASDIEAAKTRAKAKLALLDSPYGKWLTDYGVMYQLRMIPAVGALILLAKPSIPSTPLARPQQVIHYPVRGSNKAEGALSL